MHFLKSFTLKSWATYGKVAKNSTGRSHTPVVRLPPLMLCIMPEQRPRLGGYRWREAGAVVRLHPLLLLMFLLVRDQVRDPALPFLTSLRRLPIRRFLTFPLCFILGRLSQVLAGYCVERPLTVTVTARFMRFRRGHWGRG